jgi:hypothetical protein
MASATASAVRRLSSTARPNVRCANPGLRATIFGAYGFVGRYVTSLLAGDGIQCVIPWRGDDMEWRHLKVNGDLGIVMPRPYSPKDKDSMRRCIEGSDIVINLCGKVRPGGKPRAAHSPSVATDTRCFPLSLPSPPPPPSSPPGL